jgi:dephospho-CoA kinase
MMPFRLGLTGSIGMGKSTTAAMFAAEGVPVWDADATVHRLYAPGGAAAQAVRTRFPAAMDADGQVNRARLRAMITDDPTILDALNAAVHPLVAADRAQFVDAQSKAAIILLDIPLLYETGADKDCDAVVVVSAPAEIQRARVLARGMSEADFQMILARQMPDAKKRARATFVIETLDLDSARAQVRHILSAIRQGAAHA